MIQVWHATHRIPGTEDTVRLPFMGIPVTTAARIARCEDPSLVYRFVAVVDAFELERAYELTQHIDSNRAWQQNPQVTCGTDSMSGGVRSTSVGDMLVDERTGKRYLVAMMGFEEFNINLR